MKSVIEQRLSHSAVAINISSLKLSLETGIAKENSSQGLLQFSSTDLQHYALAIHQLQSFCA